MLKKFFAVRFVTTIIVLFTMINSFVFIGLGGYMTVEGIIGIFEGGVHTDAHPGLKILESLDLFLIALVFLIFAIGIAKLFHPKADEDYPDVLPKWLDLHNFAELKLILWEAILTTMVVLFVSDIVKRDGKYDWTMMVIPAAIIVLSASIYILKKSERESAKAEE